MRKLRPCHTSSQRVLIESSQFDFRICPDSAHGSPAAGARYMFIVIVDTVPKRKNTISLCWVSSHWSICSRKTYFFFGRKPLFHSQQTNAREIFTEQNTIHFQTQNSLLARSKFISQMPLPSPMVPWHYFAEIWTQGLCARWLLWARAIARQTCGREHQPGSHFSSFHLPFM